MPSAIPLPHVGGEFILRESASLAPLPLFRRRERRGRGVRPSPLGPLAQGNDRAMLESGVHDIACQEEPVPGLRADGRRPDELRPCRIIPGVLAFAEGSALIELGQTRVLCAVSVEDRVPPFLRGTGSGWITAEYAMLPRATLTRTPREAATGRIGGRTHEIQRLIGRSLRAIADLTALGERTLTVDCDVLQADGGTRTAAITGAYVALVLACERLRLLASTPDLPSPHPSRALAPASGGEVAAGRGEGPPQDEVRPPEFRWPLRQAVAAVSAGIVEGALLLDLAYSEDSHAEVDFNVVMTEDGRFVEVQGTAEREPFDRAVLNRILDLAAGGIRSLFAVQRQALREVLGER